RLTQESMAAELEIVRRPELLRRLGFPRPLLRVFEDGRPLTPAAGRVVRYDFHYTTEGWRIFEANSDVPGGFTGSAFFTALVGAQFPEFQPPGSPGEFWAETLASAAQGGVVALLSAPGLMEDHQVIAYVADLLVVRGCKTVLAKPQQICWRDGAAHL